jgi:hypothetical protein
MVDEYKYIKGIKVNVRHGGPYDRGSADSYYRRGANPHYYVGGTGFTDRIEKEQMTAEEIEQYMIGYEENEYYGFYKEW